MSKLRMIVWTFVTVLSLQAACATGQAHLLCVDAGVRAANAERIASASPPSRAPMSPPPTLDNRLGRALLTLSTLAIVAWHAACWWRYGRDPRPGTVYPLFEPPDGYEPGYIGYAKRLRFTPEVLTADLIDLAVRGYLVLEPPEKDVFRISKTTQDWGPELSVPHRALLGRLFEEGLAQHVFLGADRHVRHSPIARFTRRTIADLPGFYGVDDGSGKKEKLLIADRPLLVNWNAKLSSGGLLLLIPFFLSVRLANPALLRDAIVLAAFSIFAAIFVGGLIFALKLLRQLLHPDTGTTRGAAAALTIVILFTIAFGGVLYATGIPAQFAVMLRQDPFLTLCTLTALLTIHILGWLMPARTAAGRELADRVAGFERYLATAEKHRLETLFPAGAENGPEQASELFERFLPYAFALGVAETWADSFSVLLEQADYRPQWYRGTGGIGIGGLSDGMNGLRTSIHSAAVTSGRGGKTSSGGGGGGGGGSGR